MYNCTLYSSWANIENNLKLYCTVIALLIEWNENNLAKIKLKHILYDNKVNDKNTYKVLKVK